MKDNINALDELNKGCNMGSTAISYIYDKIENKKLQKELEKQNKKYKEISKKINDTYPKYNKDDTPHKINKMEKMMTFWGIEMKTMTDDTDSKLTELLVQGTNMGIIEGRRILNNKSLDKEVHKLAEEYTSLGEEAVEELKKYL